MICNSARVVLVLTICGILVAGSERPVDCRKFVFAPLCRGVAAKRGSPDHGHGPPAVYLAPKSFREFLRNIYPNVKLGRDDESDEEVDPLRKFYHKEGGEEEKVYKLFRESKRPIAETDNVVPVVGREYETL